MTHRIQVNIQTGEITQVEYTPEEQEAHDVAVAKQLQEQQEQQQQEQQQQEQQQQTT